MKDCEPPDLSDEREREAFKLGIHFGFFLGMVVTAFLVVILDAIFGGC